MQKHDIIIIGGGIVGLATAWRSLERFPHRSIAVLEKESKVARHQTGNNSGVLHSGIYYKPGSLKAENCREGKRAMEEFCAAENIAYEICGKVIVAIHASELPALDRIYERGQANGISCEMIGTERLAELEPHAAGIKAIHVPDAGIIDFTAVCKRLAEKIISAGGEIITGARVTRLRCNDQGATLSTTAGDFQASLVVNCAGLHSDRVARMSGHRPEEKNTAAKIVPFRGEYYDLTDEASHLCRNLIYPVPDPKFPFLGVHFTRMIQGGVECGPNAVLAFAREGYRKRDINLRDLFESLGYIGFRRMAWKHWRMGAGEMWRSISRRAFVHALQRLVPEIREKQITPAPAGVRAQALTPEGAMVDDFLIESEARTIHVLNAPSPAATSSLNIGRVLVDRIAERLP